MSIYDIKVREYMSKDWEYMQMYYQKPENLGFITAIQKLFEVGKPNKNNRIYY